MSVAASNGSFSVTIRYSIDPTEKMSDRLSTMPPSACSGDMYATLPLMTPAAVCSRLRCALAMPKSVSLISPWSLISTLFGLMSRWTIPSGLPSRRLGVRVGQRPADAGGDVQAQRRRPDHGRRVGALQDLLQVPAVDQLQHHEVAPAGDAQVQHLRDVAVLQAHRDVSLVEQHVPELRVGGVLGQDPLEHDRLLETLGAVLDGEEDLGHPAVGELAQDCVAPVRRHSRRLRYHPPTATWPTDRSESTTATMTRAAPSTAPRPKPGPRCWRPWASSPQPRPPRRTRRRAPVRVLAAARRPRPAGRRRPGARERHRRSVDDELPADLPFGYHRLLPARRRRDVADREPRALLPARRPAHLGLRRAALRGALDAPAGASAIWPISRALGRWTRRPGRRRS